MPERHAEERPDEEQDEHSESCERHAEFLEMPFPAGTQEMPNADERIHRYSDYQNQHAPEDQLHRQAQQHRMAGPQKPDVVDGARQRGKEEIIYKLHIKQRERLASCYFLPPPPASPPGHCRYGRYRLHADELQSDLSSPQGT